MLILMDLPSDLILCPVILVHWAFKYVEAAKLYLTGYKDGEDYIYKGSLNGQTPEMANFGVFS